MRRAIPLIAVLVLVAACAVPEARLRAGLVNAGLSRPLAACMAERMVDRLSLMQLRRIGDLPRAREGTLGGRVPAPDPRFARPPNPLGQRRLGRGLRGAAAGRL